MAATKPKWYLRVRDNLRDLLALSKSVELQLLIASMSYTTLLSVVPLLALTLAIISSHMDSHPEFIELVKTFVYRYLAPGSEEQIVAAFNEFLGRIDHGVLGWMGFFSLSFTSVMLMNDIATAVKRIWQQPDTTPFYRRWLRYALVAAVGPLGFVTLLFVLTSEYLSFLFNLPLVSIGAVTSYALLFSIYKWVPTQRVSIRCAAIGAGVSVVLIFLARLLYMWVTTNILQYNKVYGSLAAIPVFIVWVWILWAMVLFGVALTATLQKRRTLHLEELGAKTTKKLSIIFLLVLWAASGGEASAKSAKKLASREICPHIHVLSHEKIEFSKNERRLICGDEHPAWKEVPLNQARGFIKLFLQDRGYFDPQFEQRDGKLAVTPGKQAMIKKLEVHGVKRQTLDGRKKRKVRRHTLTPSKLDEVEAWAKLHIQDNGYPCPDIQIKAFADSGLVNVHVDRQEREFYEAIVEQNTDGLKPHTLRRFDAFVRGQRFSQMLNSLTANRIEADGIMQNASLLAICPSDKEPFTIKETLIPGKPRLFSIGFGANTETLLLAKSSLKFQRLDPHGSSVGVTLLASFVKQELFANWDWYLLERTSRWYLKPTITISHEDEEQFEILTGELRLGPAAKLDTEDWSHNLFLGPAWSWTRTLEGVAQDDAYFLSAVFEVESMTHDFEYFRSKPRSGSYVKASTTFNSNRLVSDLTAHRLMLKAEHLWNLGHYSPPLFVLGVRVGLASTFTDPDAPNFNVLPPNYFHFLGGSTDLRGFERQELPKEGLTAQDGALTTAFGSTELRWVEVLPWGIEPMLFADIGATGNESGLLDAPYYWNPGGGVRLQTPIGVFRSTVAYGFLIDNDDAALNDLSHFQFYISYGEEF